MDNLEKQQEQTAAVWSRAALTYGEVGPRFFQFFGNELVEFAQVPAGAQVLDVATGRGAVLFPAAEKVGPQGYVTGIDYSPGMVEQTNAEIEARGVSNAHALHMNAEELTFSDGSFDIVFCAFALFFFPHLDRALSEFRRVLKPGGRLVVSTWAPDDPRWAWMSALQPPQSEQQQQQRKQYEETFGTPEGVQRLLAGAGFGDLRGQQVEREFFYASPDEWWATAWSHGARCILERVPPDLLERGRLFAYQKVAEMVGPDGAPMTMRAIFTEGTAPVAG